MKHKKMIFNSEHRKGGIYKPPRKHHWNPVRAAFTTRRTTIIRGARRGGILPPAFDRKNTQGR
jgi:hypothetical protein